MSRDAPATHRWLWRRYAGAYDALEGVVGYQEMLNAVIAAAAPLAGATVLEVGCGTGNVLTRLLAERPARLTGIDLSAEMLAPARSKLSHAVRTGSVALLEGDATIALADIAAASIDVLVISNVLYALPERASFWSRAERVLAPAGRVVVSNPDRAGFGPVVRQQWRERGAAGFVDRRLLEVVVLNVAIDVVASTGRYAFLSWEDLTAEAGRAGLGRATMLGRCYGGPVDGINVVGVLART